MTETHFHHVGVACEDPITTERWYTRHFGFERARVVPLGSDQIVFIKRGDLYLELFRASEERATTPPGGTGPESPAWKHLAFKVDSVDDKLTEMGDDVRITLGPADFGEFIPGWKTAWVADPDGNIVEISEGFVDEENSPPLPQ